MPPSLFRLAKSPVQIGLSAFNYLDDFEKVFQTLTKFDKVFIFEKFLIDVFSGIRRKFSVGTFHSVVTLSRYPLRSVQSSVGLTVPCET